VTNIIHVKSYERRKPGHSDKFVETTKALAAHVLSERQWESFVGEVLSMELAERLSEPLDSEQFNDMPEEWKQRVRGTY
jgi:hypothetical protein